MSCPRSRAWQRQDSNPDSLARGHALGHDTHSLPHHPAVVGAELGLNPGPHSALCPWSTWGSWAPPLRSGAWQPGPQFVRDARGGPETDPRDRGSLSACRWAGRPGLCSPAQEPVRCKLIRHLLRLPRRREQLEGPAQASKWKLHVRAAELSCPQPWTSFQEAAAESVSRMVTAAPCSLIEPTVCCTGHMTHTLSLFISKCPWRVEIINSICIHLFIHPPI